MAVSDQAVQVGDYEWPSPEVTECPFDFYAALREAGPVCQLAGHADDEYVVSRWEDICYVEEHPELFRMWSGPQRSPARAQRMLEREQRFAHEPLTPTAMPSADPPEHRLKRTPALSLVSPEKLASYEPIIRGVSNELIDAFIDRGHVDFYAEFAEILPQRVIMEIMGIPLSDYEICKRISAIIGVSETFADDEELERGRRLDEEADAYMEALVLERHRHPGEDFVSDLIKAQVARDGELALGYLIAQAHNMLFAGNVTTTHMLGSAMLLLIENPAEMARVRANRRLIRPMLDEVLRLETPVQFIWREAVKDTTVGGVAIPADARVLLLLAAANRDDRRFPDPDRFTVDRPRVVKDSLAFGRGIHLCVGKPIARIEGDLAFNVLFDRMEEIRLAVPSSEIRHLTNPSFRAPAQLPLEFTAAR